MKTGIIGLGVVGGTLFDCLSRFHLMSGFDIKPPFNTEDHFTAVLKSVICFVCVPTPTGAEGDQDISAIRNVLYSLSRNSYLGVVVLKSTVLPGTTAVLSMTYPNLRLVHSPEFLTERNAKQDFWRQNYVLASGKPKDVDVLEKCYRDLQNEVEVDFDPQILRSENYADTELAKYLHNTFLATKVAFMNQFYDYAQEFGANYSVMAAMAMYQGGIGLTHNKVPGPDGRRGYGGMCFPKDTKALRYKAGPILSILDAAIQYNDKIRKD